MDKPDLDKVPFRLAFRLEGEWVSVYVAQPRTMDDAVLVATMRRSMMEEDKQLWEEWKAVLLGAMDRLVSKFGATPEKWTVMQAPEHERTGDA